jgi:uncharacterized damage-inducible protein DinB
MKDHFLKLFRYDYYANLQILNAIFAANQPQSAVRLMAHLLGAQQIWLSRCTEIPLLNHTIWPDWQAILFRDIIENNYKAITSYLSDRNDNDFAKKITYYNSKGDKFTNTLTDILTQVTNHGTHHRAQIGLLLKEAGLTQLPIIDYIFFMRSQNS